MRARAAVLALAIAHAPGIGSARADEPVAAPAAPPAPAAPAPAAPALAAPATPPDASATQPAANPGTPPAPTAAAAPAPQPTQGSRRAAIPEELRPEVRIQRRFIEKRSRFAIYGGLAYLARGDFYTSPGVEAAVSFYPAEIIGIDLRGAWFFSAPTREQVDIVRRTGLVPDSRPSKASLLLGGRLSLGYAKIRVSARRVVHFEPQLLLYGGVHLATGDRGATLAAPMGELGLGFLIFATRMLQARLDAGVTLGGEQRTRYELVVGGYPALDVGVMF